MLKNRYYSRSFTILNFKQIIHTLLVMIASYSLMSPANAITQSIKLTSVHGYTVETTFSYDNINQVSTMIKEEGFGKTHVLDSMKVSFYEPSGELISSYENIVDGIAQGKYFEFNFDPVNQKLLGNIDLGGEIAGEMYLKGEAKQKLSLVKVEAIGVEKVIDQIVR